MKQVCGLFLIILGFSTHGWSQDSQAVPKPRAAQLAWHAQPFYLFTHFGPNTFSGEEWGSGKEADSLFNPTDLDCRQWCRIAKEAGATGIIITAKHHDGFCLWPSKYSTHTVRESGWKDGKGDVLKELSDACREYDLHFGVYLSPWDRNHPAYGTDEYNDVYAAMLEEILTNYGPIWELWWDGANGEGPNGKKQVYDWTRFREIVRRLAPETVVFSDVGPDIRWVGNERGIAGSTNWNTIDTAGYTPGLGAPGTDVLNQGLRHGKAWLPAECDVSIRPGWFYRAAEDEKVKTPAQLFDLYLKSVGRGSTLLLNVPPDQEGHIHAQDSAALMQFAALREKSFAENKAAKKGRGEIHYKGTVYRKTNMLDGDRFTSDPLTDYREGLYWVKFNPVEKINCIVLKEDLREGQQIAAVTITLANGTKVLQRINLTTVGQSRIITFPAVAVSGIQVQITDANGTPKLSEIEAYLIDESLIEKPEK